MTPNQDDEKVCRQPAGQFMPVIDRNRCEGKGPCVAACPFDVFAMSVITREERSQLSIKGKLKALVHRGKQSRAVHADRCQACGECVEVCPEKAIKLQRVVDAEHVAR